MNRKILLTTLLLHFSRASSRETIVSIDDKDKTQYHEVNYDTRSYNFGYEVGTNRQFHHEVRGSDGVTYGCFGYFDPDDKLLMTHYVADAHGYRLIESNKPVKIYPVVFDPKSSSLDKSENSIEPKMILTEWKDLYLPKGCRMIEKGHFNNNRNNEGSNDLRNIPLPGIGVTHTHNNPPHSQTSHGAGIGGQFTGAFGNTGSFNLGHGNVPAQNTNTQSNSQPDFPSEGSDNGAQSTQGSSVGGISESFENHNHIPSSSPNQSEGSSHGHGFEHGGAFSFDHISGGHHISHNHETTSRKPGNHEHGGSFSHGHVSGGHQISHNHETTSKKPAKPTSTTHKPGGSFTIGTPNHQIGVTWGHQNQGQGQGQGQTNPPKTTTKKPDGHFEHGGSFSHGHVSGGHQIGGTWGHQNQGQGQTNPPKTTTKKPDGHFEHGGSFSHGHVSGGHQIGGTWGHQNQGQGQTNPPKTTTKKPGGHFEHGGSFSHGHVSGGHQIGGTWGHQNQSQGQGQGQTKPTTTKKPGGHFEHGGSFSHGHVSGGHQIGGTWGHQGHQENNSSNHFEHGGHFEHGNTSGGHHVSGGHQTGQQGSNQGYYPNNENHEGYYRPDNSGSYNHQPGPHAPPYIHTQGPQGGQGGHEGHGGSGGQGGYGPNGPYGHGSEYHPGGYRPDPNNPDANCNHSSHKPYPTTHHPYPTQSSTTHSTTRKTTKTSTTRPQTAPTTYRPTPTTYRPTPTRPIPTRPNTYPTRPSSTPNPTGSQGGNLGVQPPSTRPPQYTPNPGLFVPGNYQPLFFVPFPFALAPTCPCYYMHSHNGNFSSQLPYGNVNAQWQSQNNQQQPQYAIGLIPVLFVPHCMPSSNYSNDIPGQYLQVPYPCAQCNYLQNHRDGRELLNENSNEVFSSSDSFKQVLAQAGVNSLDTFFVRSPPRRMRMKKIKRVQNNPEQKENETQETTSTSA